MKSTCLVLILAPIWAWPPRPDCGPHGGFSFLSPPPPLQHFMKQLSYFTSCILPTTALPRSANLACHYENSSERLARQHLAGEWPLCRWTCGYAEHRCALCLKESEKLDEWLLAGDCRAGFSAWQQKFPTSGVIMTHGPDHRWDVHVMVLEWFVFSQEEREHRRLNPIFDAHCNTSSHKSKQEQETVSAQPSKSPISCNADKLSGIFSKRQI